MMSPLRPCPLDYAAVKSRADRLARHLADPRNPGACSACLDEFAYHLNGDWLEHLPRLRAECHALFDACIAVLALHRTPDELAPLAVQLRLNLGRCSVHRLDRRFRLRDPSMYVVNLLDCASDIVRDALRHGAHAFADRAARAGKTFADKQGRWPARVEQLFPGGTHATVENLLHACELYVSDGPLDALATLLLVARPVVRPVLARDACVKQLVSVLLKMLDPVGSGIARGKPWLLKGRQAVDTACRMLEVIIGGPGSLPGEGSLLLAGHEPALLRILTAVTDPLGDDDLMLPGLITICGELSARSSLPVPPRIEGWRVTACSHGDCDDQRGIPQQFCGKILLLLASRACAGPGCTLSVLQKEDGKPFPACARCKVPSYCSRACQRADWRGEDGHAPHKIICGIFSAINARACTEDTLPQFEEAFVREERHFHDAETDVVRAFLASFCRHAGAHTAKE